MAITIITQHYVVLQIDDRPTTVLQSRADDAGIYLKTRVKVVLLLFAIIKRARDRKETCIFTGFIAWHYRRRWRRRRRRRAVC